MEYVIGVDIGGTFTDCVILDSNGKLSIGKALSTPTTSPWACSIPLRTAPAISG